MSCWIICKCCNVSVCLQKQQLMFSICNIDGGILDLFTYILSSDGVCITHLMFERERERERNEENSSCFSWNNIYYIWNVIYNIWCDMLWILWFISLNMMIKSSVQQMLEMWCLNCPKHIQPSLWVTAVKHVTLTSSEEMWVKIGWGGVWVSVVLKSQTSSFCS